MNDLTTAFQLIINLYGLDFAKLLECLFRNETAHFSSGQWKNCFAPGMEMVKGTSKPCYGWYSLDVFWQENPNYAPIGIWSAVDNNSALSESTGEQGFLQFASPEAGIMSVGKLISLRGGNFGSWFSTDSTAQAKYVAVLNTIIPRICDSLAPTTPLT